MTRPRIKHLFTDASCIHQRGIASWAGMIVDGIESSLQSGLIPVLLRNGTAAEAYGVRLALRQFIKIGWIAPGDTIIVHCDNQGVIAHIADDRQPLPKEMHFRSQIERIRRIAAHYQLALCGQWIKGHQSRESDDIRSLINQRVDRAATTLSKAEHKRRIALGDFGRVPKAQQIEQDAAE